MRGLLDSFNNLSIVLRILIIIALIVVLVFGVMTVSGLMSDDSPDDNDTASAPESDVTTDTDDTQTPADADTDVTLPEDDIADDALPAEDEDIIEGEAEYDPAFDVDGDETEADTDDTADNSPEAIKSEQTPELQAIWDDKDWSVVTYNNTFGPDTISVEFPESDIDAVETYGDTLVDLSLLSIEVPMEVANEAIARIDSFITDADIIVVEQDPASDNPKRVYIHADFVNVQEVLLEEGLAKVSTADGDTQYMDSFKEYEQSAKDDKLGVWAE